MKTDEDIEAYLLRMELPFENPSEGLWLVHDEDNHVDNIVIYHNPPIVTIRVKVMPVPEENQLELYQKLLILNATDLVHCAYGIEDDAVVVLDTLQSPNLDFNELQASVDAIVMALRDHYGLLNKYNTASSPEQQPEG